MIVSSFNLITINLAVRKRKIGLGRTVRTIGPSKPKKLLIPRTKTPIRPLRPISPATSSVMVEVSSIRGDEITKARKDSVELSMEEKRKVGGQEAAADKLRSKLIQLQKGKEEDTFVSIKSKPEVTAARMTEIETFMSRFPYKSCQRSIIGDLRRKRSLSQPAYMRYNYIYHYR